MTFGSSYRSALDAIERASIELALRQREVATGRRIHVPSDDPSDAASAVTSRSEIATLDRYTRATSSVGARLGVVDSILSDVVSNLTAALSTATSATGSTPNSTQREAAATALEGIRDGIFADLTTQYRGSHLFSGAQSTTAPYTQGPGGTVSAYQGDANTVSVDIDRQLAIQVSFDGQTIAQGGDPDDLFGVLDDLAAAIRAGDSVAIDAGLTALRSGFDRVVAVQTQVGVSLRAIDMQQLRLGDRVRTEQTRLSRLEDVNLVEAISGLNAAETAFQAALSSAANLSRPMLLDFLR